MTALADAGEPDRGRVFLEGWPAAMRDAATGGCGAAGTLSTTIDPTRPSRPSEAALEVLPHDWRTHYRLARALILNRAEEAQKRQ